MLYAIFVCLALEGPCFFTSYAEQTYCETYVEIANRNSTDGERHPGETPEVFLEETPDHIRFVCLHRNLPIWYH